MSNKRVGKLERQAVRDPVAPLRNHSSAAPLFVTAGIVVEAVYWIALRQAAMLRKAESTLIKVERSLEKSERTTRGQL